MPEFLTLTPPFEALDLFLAHIQRDPVPEQTSADLALGRVTVFPIFAAHPLPEFPRSTVDGYAVRAADTHGAGEALPAYLALIGEVPMGAAATLAVGPAQCVLIHTGGMLPPGADAVVMLEHTQTARPGEIEVLRAVAGGDNLIEVGEDVKQGELVIPAGTRLRPAEIGGLMALGVTRLEVARRPRVAILSSGDEVIPPDQQPRPGQVRDVNAHTLAALVTQNGGIPVQFGVIPDRREAMRAAVSSAKDSCDLVVVTAGSSASTRDLTAEVFREMGQPGVLVHGVNVRPGKPTILAVCDGAPMVGLPGNPVSALVIAGLFVAPAIRRLLGEQARPQPTATARLAINLASQTGREEWVAVRLIAGPQGWLAEPIFGKSNLIFTLARADGLVHVAASATGLEAGASVAVELML